MLSFARTEKYCTKLADEIMKLRGEKYLIDFKIHVRDDEFPCAKFVMAAHSPMLRAMLTSDMAEVAKQEIRLDHIRKDIIQIILDYMYCEDVSFHKDQLMDLLAAADYLQMTELKKMCLDEVPDILESDNVISWWKEATKMNYDTINELCEEIMATDFKQISQQTDFLNLDLNEVQHYVSDILSDTVISDDTVDATMRWVGHKEERIVNVEGLLHNVQLNRCSARGIKNTMETYESLLDKTPVVCKLLLKTLAGIATDISKAITDIIIVGGREGKRVSPVCWKVNQSNEIVHLCDIPDDDLAGNASVCKFPQGFVITGGAGSCLCLIFIASSRLWVKLQDITEDRQCHGSIFVEEILYVLGGYVGEYTNGSKPSGSVDMMIMKDGNWASGPNIPLAVKFPKVSKCENTVFLLDAEKSKKLFRLDIDKGVWNELAQLPLEQNCFGLSMSSARGRLFVAGGEHLICHWYIPDSNIWCTGQQPLQLHRYGTLTFHEDKLLLLGGSFEGGTDAVEEYDIDEDKWRVCSYKMPKKLHLHHAVVLNMQSHD